MESPTNSPLQQYYDLRKAHHHSSHHRQEILNSDVCGCFYCLETYPPAEIREWTDELEEPQATALCPNCGIDAVVGTASGFPIVAEFLELMESYCLGPVSFHKN